MADFYEQSDSVTAGEVAAEKRIDARRTKIVSASARYIERNGPVRGDGSGLRLRTRSQNVLICYR